MVGESSLTVLIGIHYIEIVGSASFLRITVFGASQKQCLLNRRDWGRLSLAQHIFLGVPSLTHGSVNRGLLAIC